MLINSFGILEEIIAWIIIVIITAIATSKKPRIFLLSSLKWLRLQWRYVIVCVYVVSLVIAIHVIYSDWITTLFVLVSISLAFMLFLLISRKKTERVVFYDFRKPLQTWKPTANWLPEIDVNKGTKIEPHDKLTKYIESGEIDFLTGVIECDVMLDRGAILNIVFRGKIRESFYMVRLDTRVHPDADLYDCILFSPIGNTGWHICNKAKGQSGHTSSANEYLNVKIICTRKTATLVVNGYQVDTVTNLQLKTRETSIVIFAELANAYVKRLQVIETL